MYGILKTWKSENYNFVNRDYEIFTKLSFVATATIMQMVISSLLEYLNLMPLDYNLGESKKILQAKFYPLVWCSLIYQPDKFI